MERANKIEGLIEPTLTELGYELVRVQMTAGRQATLQIMAERLDRRPMRVEDCAKLSRQIAVLLEADDPVGGDYELEVSSPGIDRPLMKRADYERYAGHEVRLEIDPPVEGQKRFHGNISGVEGDTIVLETALGSVSLPLAVIAKAKLVLTDRLIAAVQIESNEAAGPVDMPAQVHL